MIIFDYFYQSKKLDVMRNGALHVHLILVQCSAIHREDMVDQWSSIHISEAMMPDTPTTPLELSSPNVVIHLRS